ncbi:NUDIX hydrolase [Enterococcus sp. LJL99]
MNDEAFEEKTISREAIYKGKIIEVVVDEVELPNGKMGKRELVFHPGAVAMIPITKDNKILLVKQFRKPLEKIILEIPAGKLESGEQDQLLEAAKRELEEETGFRPEKIACVQSMYLSPGFANECLHVFYAEGLEKVEHPRPQDEDEVLELYELTLDEAKEKIISGQICDAKTVFAIMYWELKQLKKNKEDSP